MGKDDNFELDNFVKFDDYFKGGRLFRNRLFPIKFLKRDFVSVINGCFVRNLQLGTESWALKIKLDVLYGYDHIRC